MIITHGPGLGPAPGGFTPRAFNILRATCPCTFDLANIEALIAFLARRQRARGFDLDVDAAMESARARIEPRRRKILALRAEDKPVDLGGGWFALNTQFDRGEAIVTPWGKVLRAPPWRDPRAASFETGPKNRRLAANPKARRR